MVDRIGEQSSLAREAILAAMRTQSRSVEAVRDGATEVQRAGPAAAGPREAEGNPDLGEGFREGVRAVQEELAAAERLPEDMLAGQIGDFHEVAIRIKRADVTFKFAMEVRNKLIDAYREVMRMSV